MAVSKPPSPPVLGGAKSGIAAAPAMASPDDRTNTRLPERLRTVSDNGCHKETMGAGEWNQSAFVLMTDFLIVYRYLYPIR